MPHHQGQSASMTENLNHLALCKLSQGTKDSSLLTCWAKRRGLWQKWWVPRQLAVPRWAAWWCCARRSCWGASGPGCPSEGCEKRRAASLSGSAGSRHRYHKSGERKHTNTHTHWWLVYSRRRTHLRSIYGPSAFHLLHAVIHMHLFHPPFGHMFSPMDLLNVCPENNILLEFLGRPVLIRTHGFHSNLGGAALISECRIESIKAVFTTYSKALFLMFHTQPGKLYSR